MMQRVHHQDGKLGRRQRGRAPRGDGLLRLFQHGVNAGRRERAAHKAPHPIHHLALAQPAHGQRKQHFAQIMALIFFQQPDLGLPAQTRNAHLV
jgi:hypothetical protein